MADTVVVVIEEDEQYPVYRLILTEESYRGFRGTFVMSKADYDRFQRIFQEYSEMQLDLQDLLTNQENG